MSKSTQKISMALSVFMLFALFCPWAYGQETPPGETASVRESAPVKEAMPKRDKWQVDVVPYFWAAGLTGTVGVKGIDSSLNMSFTDLVKYVDAGGMAHVEARKGDWGFFADGIYLKLSADGNAYGQRVGFVSGRVTVEEWIVELGGLYRIGQWSLGSSKENKLSLDALGGGRYWHLKGSLDLSASNLRVFVDQSASKEWVDPFVGLRARADLTKKLVFELRGDIGGFGVGSDFSWNTSGIFGYSFTPMISGYLGYRAMGVNYESGNGLSKFKYDVTMYGPIAGMGFRF